MRGEILVVEDDEAIAQLAVAVLAREGYEAASAPTVGNARKALEKRTEWANLCLIVDVVLQNESGIQFAEEIAKAHPQIRVLMVSGFTDEVLMMKPEISTRTAFLRKPFTRDELISAVERIFRQPTRREPSA